MDKPDPNHWLRRFLPTEPLPAQPSTKLRIQYLAQHVLDPIYHTGINDRGRVPMRVPQKWRRGILKYRSAIDETHGQNKRFNELVDPASGREDSPKQALTFWLRPEALGRGPNAVRHLQLQLEDFAEALSERHDLPLKASLFVLDDALRDALGNHTVAGVILATTPKHRETLARVKASILNERTTAEVLAQTTLRAAAPLPTQDAATYAFYVNAASNLDEEDFLGDVAAFALSYHVLPVTKGFFMLEPPPGHPRPKQRWPVVIPAHPPYAPPSYVLAVWLHDDYAMGGEFSRRMQTAEAKEMSTGIQKNESELLREILGYHLGVPISIYYGVSPTTVRSSVLLITAHTPRQEAVLHEASAMLQSAALTRNNPDKRPLSASFQKMLEAQRASRLKKKGEPGAER